MAFSLKILVVEDHLLVQDGMCLLLQQLGEDVQTVRATDCLSAQAIISDYLDINLILLDIDLPGSKGLGCLISLRSLVPQTPIVMVTANENLEVIRRAIACGAQGYIPKTVNQESMLAALRVVLSGGSYMPASALIKAPRVQSISLIETETVQLTPKQQEVLLLLATGKSNKAIGRALGTTEGTVRIHVTAILKALQAHNRTEAIIRARQLHLLPEQPV